MKCGHCAADNRSDRRFCADCGKALPVACPACGFANEPEASFCGGCGTALVVADAAVTGSAQSEGERRPITVLFADLAGFTRMSRSLDPEEVHRLLERYFETVDTIVESYGGSIDKHIGDSVMAVFGAPIAHGDDAVRAVRAAAEIHYAVDALHAELGRPLAVHIGIAAGEVMASGLGSARHRAYTVIGQSVNLAARLLQQAGPGETVLDDAVHGATERVARCVAIDAVHVKGIDAPLRAWRLQDIDRGVALVPAQPFVGRKTEVAQLRSLLEACMAGGRGGTAFVRGEAGMGKSRLIGELRTTAQAAGFACHAGLVLDFGMSRDRNAVRDLVGGLLDLAPQANDDERQAAAQRAQRDGGSAARRAALADLLDLPQPPATRALFEGMDRATRQRGRADALSELAGAAALRQPVLLIVEDLHWADSMTLDYVSALTRAVADVPAMLALTSRIDGDPLDAAWRATLQGAPLTTIDLGPLPASDAVALASGLFATSQRFAQQCIERSGGNPLFLEQLLRAADEHDDSVPTSLQSLVLARVDRLPERDRLALRVAAVIGQRFSLSVVRVLANLPDYTCANLLDRALVRAEGDEFLFGHALIRDGVYASLTRARRAELHRAAAQWFRERDPALYAEHLDRAGAPETARAYLAAARVHAGALKLERALALAQRGTALATERPDVYALNMICGDLLLEIGDGKPATDAYQRALDAADDPQARCRALLGVAAGQRLIGGIDAALAALAQAEPIARAYRLVREQAELHGTRGNLHFAQGRIAECRAEHEVALAAARTLASSELEARALSGLADADYLESRMRTAFDKFRRCVALCEAHGYARIAVPNQVMVGHCRTYLLEFDVGLAEMIAARDAAVQIGNRHVEMFATQSCGLLLTVCARYADAEPFQERAQAMAEALGARRYLAVIHAHCAEVRIAAGRTDEARERLHAGLALARETGVGFCGPMLLALLARVTDDPKQRAALHAEARAWLEHGAVGHSYIAYYRLGIEDAIARADWAMGLQHAAALAAHTAREPLPYTDYLIARGRALIALGQRPQDRALHEEVLRLRAEAGRLRWSIGWPVWAIADERMQNGGANRG